MQAEGVLLTDLALYEGQVVYGIERGQEGEYKRFSLYVIVSDRERQDYDLPEMVNITRQVMVLLGLWRSLSGSYLLAGVTGRQLVQCLSLRLFSRNDYLKYQEL